MVSWDGRPDLSGGRTTKKVKDRTLKTKGCGTLLSDTFLNYAGVKPEQVKTGRRGYLGKLGSVKPSWQRKKTESRAEVILRE